MSCQSNGKPLLDWKLGMDPPSSLLHCSFCSLLHPSLCFLRHWVPGSLQCDKSWMALDSLAGLLSQKDLRELAREELNYSPPWRRDFVALTTPHTGLIEEPDVSVSVAIIFPCSIFLKEAWLNTSQPVLWVSRISRRAYCISLGNLSVLHLLHRQCTCTQSYRDGQLSTHFSLSSGDTSQGCTAHSHA